MFWNSPTSAFTLGDGSEAYVNSWYGSNASLSASYSVQQRYPLRFLRFTASGALTTGGERELAKLVKINRTGDTVLLFDGVFAHQEVPNRLSLRHAKQTLMNILYADGHAGSARNQELPQVSTDFTDDTQAIKFQSPRWRMDLK
jgi:prepilin-type processing-associated H-X9-DG protein